MVGLLLLFLLGITASRGRDCNCLPCKYIPNGQHSGDWTLKESNCSSCPLDSNTGNGCLYVNNGTEAEKCFCDPGDTRYGDVCSSAVTQDMSTTLASTAAMTSAIPTTITAEGGGWVEYIGQHFTDNQCRNLGNKANHDLSACKTVCDGNNGCTAINFNLGAKICTLRACGPAGSAAGWNSYMKSGVWVEYIGHFTDNQCRNLGNKLNHDLSACKTVCDGTNGCTAINFNLGQKICTQRACGPVGSAAGWNSYTKPG